MMVIDLFFLFQIVPFHWKFKTAFIYQVPRLLANKTYPFFFKTPYIIMGYITTPALCRPFQFLRFCSKHGTWALNPCRYWDFFTKWIFPSGCIYLVSFSALLKAKAIWIVFSNDKSSGSNRNLLIRFSFLNPHMNLSQSASFKKVLNRQFAANLLIWTTKSLMDWFSFW